MRETNERKEMQLIDIQMVLDRLANNYSHISPKILRSSIEYAKVCAPSIDTDDGAGGKSNLYAKAQGYLEGYCRVVDEFYNTDAIGVGAKGIVSDIMDKVAIDFGEEAPTYFLACCADYLRLLLLSEDEENISEETKRLLHIAGIGFMEGAIAADLGKEFNEHIKPIYEPFSQDKACIAYDIVADEIKLSMEDPDESEYMKKTATSCLIDMMNRLVTPKSGNAIFSTGDPLSCAMMYLLGYVNGIMNSEKDMEYGVDLEDLCKLDSNQEKQLSFSDTLVSIWGSYNGYDDGLIEKAYSMMRDDMVMNATILDNENRDTKGSNASDDNTWNKDTTIIALMGIGFSDGSWMSSSDDDNEQVLREMEISDEIDLVFAAMDIRIDE